MANAAKTRKQPLIRRSFLFVGGGLALFLAAVLLFRYTAKEETLLHAAETCMAAVERADARTLMRYIRDEEREILALNETKLATFLTSFCQKRMQGFERIGEDERTALTGAGNLVLTRKYRHSDGREAYMMLTVMPSDHGPKLLNLVTEITFGTLSTYWPKEEDQRPPVVRGVFVNTKALEEAIADLETMPLEGMAITRATTMEFRSWRQTLERFRASSDRIRKQDS